MPKLYKWMLKTTKLAQPKRHFWAHQCHRNDSNSNLTSIGEHCVWWRTIWSTPNNSNSNITSSGETLCLMGNHGSTQNGAIRILVWMFSKSLPLPLFSKTKTNIREILFFHSVKSKCTCCKIPQILSRCHRVIGSLRSCEPLHLLTLIQH
jgi:hypothetical protein